MYGQEVFRIPPHIRSETRNTPAIVLVCVRVHVRTNLPCFDQTSELALCNILVSGLLFGWQLAHLATIRPISANPPSRQQVIIKYNGVVRLKLGGLSSNADELTRVPEPLPRARRLLAKKQRCSVCSRLPACPVIEIMAVFVQPLGFCQKVSVFVFDCRGIYLQHVLLMLWKRN